MCVFFLPLISYSIYPTCWYQSPNKSFASTIFVVRFAAGGGYKPLLVEEQWKSREIFKIDISQKRTWIAKTCLVFFLPRLFQLILTAT